VVGALRGELDVDEEIQREECEAWIHPYIARTMTLVDQALKLGWPGAGEIEAVLLVGGPSCLPLVRRLLVEKFGEEKIKADVDPMLCNALGAAAVAARSAGVVCDDWLRKCPHCGALHRPWAEVCDQTGGPLGRG